MGPASDLLAAQHLAAINTKLKPIITEKTQETIVEQSEARTELLRKAIQARKELVYIDEAVFSRRSLVNQTWRKRNIDGELSKAKLSFVAVGVVAAINTAGDIVGCVLRDGSIDVPALKELMRQIKTYYKRRKIVIFLDNLRMHYNRELKELVRKNNHELIFNAIY